MITAGGFTVDRRQIVLDKPIKTLGLHATRIALHPEVVVQVILNIARSEDEAERQARGEDVTVVKEEASSSRPSIADAVFEEEALARQKDGEEEEPELPTRPEAAADFAVACAIARTWDPTSGALSLFAQPPGASPVAAAI